MTCQREPVCVSTRRVSLGRGVVGAVVLVMAVFATWRGAFAQELDPASVIKAYSTALNAHDAAAALDLFDQYGSATDLGGRHFEGRDGLLAFLQTSGFSTPNARVSTENLHVVANRAVWTYTCSCVDGPLEARVVTNHGKITVFALNRPASYARPLTSARGRPDVLPWLIGFGALALGAAIVRHQRQSRLDHRARARLGHGRLLAALLEAQSKRPRNPAA